MCVDELRKKKKQQRRQQQGRDCGQCTDVYVYVVKNLTHVETERTYTC